MSEAGPLRAPWFFFHGVGHNDGECVRFPCHPQTRCHTNIPLIAASGKYGWLFVAAATGSCSTCRCGARGFSQSLTLRAGVKAVQASEVAETALNCWSENSSAVLEPRASLGDACPTGLCLDRTETRLAVFYGAVIKLYDVAPVLSGGTVRASVSMHPCSAFTLSVQGASPVHTVNLEDKGIVVDAACSSIGPSRLAVVHVTGTVSLVDIASGSVINSLDVGAASGASGVLARPLPVEAPHLMPVPAAVPPSLMEPR